MPQKVTSFENRIVAIITSQDEPTVENGGPQSNSLVPLLKSIHLHIDAQKEHHVKMKTEIRVVFRSFETPDC